MLLTVAVGATQGKSDAASILSRVQAESDPELGELIRIALENTRGAPEGNAFETIRKVTQSYAQIKLLDQQIDQVSQKAESVAGPAEMKYELLLAKAELESKRTKELASLRETMGVIPKFAFERQPIEGLKTWVKLQIIGDRVYILNTLSPFLEYWAMARYEAAGLVSEQNALDYVRHRIQDKDCLPVRVDVYFTPETRTASETLRDAVISLAREAGVEMKTEVRLEQVTWVGSGKSTFYVRENTIRTLYPDPVKRPDGGPELLASGLVNPNDLEQHILWRLTKPKNLPLKFRIEHDDASAELATKVVDAVKATAERLGVAQLVEVEEARVVPVPETAFVGRWESIRRGYIQTLDIQPAGVCEVVMGDGSPAIEAGTNVKGTWFATSKEVLVDINDRVWGKPHHVYRGRLDEDGALAVDRGEVYPQGSFHTVGSVPMTLMRAK
jgi:hypothetical protein